MPTGSDLIPAKSPAPAHCCRRIYDSLLSLTSGTPRRGIAGLADDDPNDAGDVDRSYGAQEDGTLLLGCQAAQVSEEHVTLTTAQISTIRTRQLVSCGTSVKDKTRGQARNFYWPSFSALHDLFSTSPF